MSVTPLFPGSVATDAQLKVAANRIETRLVGAIGPGDLSCVLQSATGITANMLISIDSEIMSITSMVGTVPVLVRGFDGTTAASHSNNAKVSVFIDAWHHNAVTAEIKAIETALGANLANIPTSPFLLSTAFKFTPQIPGGSLVIGSNTITLSPVPVGVNGSNVNHWIYISNGTGTAEACLVTGGTAVSGGTTGTLVFTCAHTHSGAWTIESASAGIREAILSAAGAVSVMIPVGSHSIYQKIVIDKDSVRVSGAGTWGTVQLGGDAQGISLAAGVILLWAGSVGGRFFEILPPANGRILDVEISNLGFDANTVQVAEFIWLKSLSGGRLVQLSGRGVANGTGTGAVYMSSGDGGSGTNRNVFNNEFADWDFVQWLTATGPMIYFDRGSNTSSDINTNVFRNISMAVYGTGFYAKNCDNNTFFNIRTNTLQPYPIFWWDTPADAVQAGGNSFFGVHTTQARYRDNQNLGGPSYCIIYGLESDDPVESQVVLGNYATLQIHNYDTDFSFAASLAVAAGYQPATRNQSGTAYYRKYANTSGAMGSIQRGGTFQIPVNTISNANPAIVMTSYAHNRSSGDWVQVSGLIGSWAAINLSAVQILVTGPTTFSIPLDTTTFGSFVGQIYIRLVGGVTPYSYPFTFVADYVNYGSVHQGIANYSTGIGENAVGVQAEAHQTNPANLSDLLGLVAVSIDTNGGNNIGVYAEASGAAANYGGVFKGGARMLPVAFAALPAASSAYEGTLQAVNNSNTAVWGAVIAGGGANHVLAFCNGSAWTVAGK